MRRQVIHEPQTVVWTDIAEAVLLVFPHEQDETATVAALVGVSASCVGMGHRVLRLPVEPVLADEVVVVLRCRGEILVRLVQGDEEQFGIVSPIW